MASSSASRPSCTFSSDLPVGWAYGQTGSAGAATQVLVVHTRLPRQSLVVVHAPPAALRRTHTFVVVSQLA